MVSSDKIVELIQFFKLYSKNAENPDLQGFAYWILQRNMVQQENETQLNTELGSLINRISKYSRFYAKVLFENLPINSLEEFSFLHAIQVLAIPSKSQVYEYTFTELTTGSQMMRRLVGIGLIEEFEDEHDKRIKRVKLSTLGHEVEQKAAELINKQYNFKLELIDKTEKMQLLSTLTKLNNYHQQVLAKYSDSLPALTSLLLS